ncbi:MAG: hypothetical protein HC857_11175 [Synechococcales cyanobacterium RU_4_20]|nr:hypothetical protein [Synechococcales cyanobacterium RU_4_20]NJR69720.1 hypothetical protein [Synechococcales cyanobacterium CRU_2_2]
MAIQITRAFSILTKLPSQTTSTSILYTANPFSDDEGNQAEVSGSLESLRIRVAIKSLVEVPLPTGLDEQGQLEAVSTLRDYQWTSQRLELDLLRRKTGSQQVIASVALMARTPFYTIDLMPFFTSQPVARIAPNDWIGVKMKDAGYGLINEIDEVVIFGEGLEEFYL